MKTTMTRIFDLALALTLALAVALAVMSTVTACSGGTQGSVSNTTDSGDIQSGDTQGSDTPSSGTSGGSGGTPSGSSTQDGDPATHEHYNTTKHYKIPKKVLTSPPQVV